MPRENLGSPSRDYDSDEVPALAIEVGRKTGARVADWLNWAAAPVFAIMALWTAGTGSNESAMLCGSQRGMPAAGMTLMYLLMGIFHGGPWVKLVLRRAN